MDFLKNEILGNSLLNWGKAGLILLIFVVGVKILIHIVAGKLKKISGKTRNLWDDVLLNIFEQTKQITVWLLGLYLALKVLAVPVEVNSFIDKGLIIVLAVQSGFWLGGVINYYVERRGEQNTGDKKEKTTIHAFGLFGKILVWMILALVVVQNVTGMKLDALITSLGIGGIAIGLAVQNILKDIFASLSIFLDKPFLVGDYIVLDDIGGTVQNIGIKSTRIKTLLGEEVIFSNSDLLEGRVHNYRKLERRREIMNIGVSTATSYQTLTELPALFKEIISSQPSVTFGRAHLSAFGDFTYNYEIEYYIESADYAFYMDTKQTIHLEVIRRFNEKHIVMPYPTQAIVMDQ
ncbi:MAG: mechanosensitive ion channel family protein [Chloroflexi bacterium]|nr:mechanosensitive ion channel family protein [Chloroflexota bacterium]